jgi:hypothetical protein
VRPNRPSASPRNSAPLYTAPTAPAFETGDKRDAWLNKVQAVAQGTLVIEPLALALSVRSLAV